MSEQQAFGRRDFLVAGAGVVAGLGFAGYNRNRHEKMMQDAKKLTPSDVEQLKNEG